MSRVLIFSRDPGGANAVLPLVVPLEARGDEVRLFGKDVALAKYATAGCRGIDIMEALGEVTPEAVGTFLEAQAPDLVVTGTSADDGTEKLLWKLAGEAGIPSLAVTDQWVNYGVRFSAHGVGEIEAYRRNPLHPYLPTLIVAIDELAREEMIAEGLPAERIVVCGQPHFETVLANRPQGGELAAFCAAQAIRTDDFVVAFASEPLTATYGERTESYWGYTERSNLLQLMRALEGVASDSARRVLLVLRPHPKEDPDPLRHLLEAEAPVPWRLDLGASQWSLMNRADLVCGMSSMFLVEAAILGRPVLSIQIGLRREDPFVLARRGLTRTVTCQEELWQRLQQFIMEGGAPLPALQVIENPVQRIVAEMEKLLCSNWQ